MSVLLARDPLLPRPPDGLGRGALLALAVHLGLLVALALAVNWRQRSPETFSAEIWAALPEQAAPRPVPREPAPTPKPAPPAVAPPVPAPAPAPTEADIALERAKLRAEQQERERQAAIDKQRRLAQEREAEEKRAREAEAALLKQQRELQRKRQEELARQAEEARRQAALEKQRQENLRRMLGQAGATGAPSATGQAARDAGPSASYAGKLIAHIRGNIVSVDDFAPTLEAVVEVRASPTGTVLSRRITRPSGNPAWDEVVLRAIDRSGRLPADTDGRVPTSIEISFRPQ